MHHCTITLFWLGFLSVYEWSFIVTAYILPLCARTLFFQVTLECKVIFIFMQAIYSSFCFDQYHSTNTVFLYISLCFQQCGDLWISLALTRPIFFPSWSFLEALITSFTRSQLAYHYLIQRRLGSCLAHSIEAGFDVRLNQCVKDAL